MAAAAQSILTSRKKQESEGAVRALRHGQLVHQLHTDTAALEALKAVDAMWAVHLDEMRREACAAVRAMQEKHEDALTKLRLEQVARAHDRGIRPERRSKELINLRRSEAVLASKNNFTSAARVKAHADDLAASEACSAHASWLLRCHGEQERLMAGQRRELEALRKRMDSRLREVEAARDTDMDKLQRKIKASTLHQQHSFVRERQFLDQALNGDLLNTVSTRPGRSFVDALPRMAELAAASQQHQQQNHEQARGSRPGASSAGSPSAAAPPDSTPGTGYLGPSSASCEGGAAGRARSEGPATALGVRFAPSQPRREAWGLADKAAEGGSGSGSDNGRADSSTSGASRPSSSSSSSTSKSSRGSGQGSQGSWSKRSVDGDGNQAPSPRPPSSHGRAERESAAEPPPQAAEPAPAVPTSAAAGSGTTAAGTGSGSSALTEEALRAMNQAGGARLTEIHRGANSLQSSSFKSNKPYAGGISARAIAKPVP
ncbi:hypothetical protein PLESTF_001555400 [Pleodorina starrii]|nr:hypothetical protein PLESTF_001555400 [Pleodorina starrii]